MATNWEHAFTGEEIWQALNDLCVHKILRPDGFPKKLYRICWPFMKDNILRVFETFANSGFFNWRLNTIFISLIPKQHGVDQVIDFRLIALLSRCYKLLAKVLANRLKLFLSSLVLYFQGATVEGRYFQDLSLMVNELLGSHMLSKVGLMFKIKFSKHSMKIHRDPGFLRVGKQPLSLFF